MKLAVLFWFYKEPEVCKNRLELLRKFNPEISIYGLYGGDVSKATHYQLLLNDYLDDFYIFTGNQNPQWKWLQGDLLLTQWYKERGKDLTWDTVVIIQWDMLVLGSIEQLFSTLESDQILLSGLRPVEEVENDWMWVAPKNPECRQQYLHFLEHVRNSYNYNLNPLGCIFIVVCLPRVFLDKYSEIEEPELGFLEYRVPIYAQIFGISFCENHPFHAWWLDCDSTYNHGKQPVKRFINLFRLKLNPASISPSRHNVPLSSIFRNLILKKGDRIFHPYQHLFPLSRQQWLQAWIEELRRDLKWLAKKITLV